MIKKIKRSKEMRLDELIKYVWDNELKADNGVLRFESQLGSLVGVDMSGQVRVYGQHYGNELFTLEVEEEITEDTRFDTLVKISDKSSVIVHHHLKIRVIKDSTTKKIYALIDGELQLVWERGGIHNV